MTCEERVPAENLRDELLQLRDLLFTLGVAGFHAGADLRLRQHHVVVGAGVGDDALVIDIRGVGADFVQEMAVVGNDDQAARVGQQVLLQPVHRVQIQVVGRLVQQQHAGVAEERLRQQHAHFLAALQLRHLALMQLFGNVQTLEQNGGIRFRRIAAFIPDDAFQLAHAHAILVGPVGGIGVELLALL